MNEAVDAPQVDKHAIGGDVLDCALEHLAFLEMRNDFFALLLKLCLDESFVRYHNILELLVDLHNLELHRFANEDIVVAYGLHVDLAAGQEGLDAKHVYNHATLGAALDVALDDFVVSKRLVNAFPALGCTGFLV